MQFHELALTFVVLVVLREIAGQCLMSLTGLGALANFGGLAFASFFAGWLAGGISEPGPSRAQLKGLAVSGVIVAIGIGFMKGVSYLALAVLFILILHTSLSYVCLLLGARVAVVGIDSPPRHQDDGHRLRAGRSGCSLRE